MKAIRIGMPKPAEEIIEALNANGREAYIVGGCVRDCLLGKEPHDWDICTSAEPEEVKAIFDGQKGWHVVETGLQHGTVTVVKNHEPYEVTTYRAEAGYSDHRHPDAVRFVDSLKEDLSRRDFTVNAMAYHPKEGLRDFFGGCEDLRLRKIRCVGEAEKRFEEDALRILRAMRFASVYGFSIEEETGRAIRHLYRTLSFVAEERIWQEMQKLLCGQGVQKILMDYPEVICHVFPELEAAVGFEQRNPYHHYSVYEHLARSTGMVRSDTVLRLTMLFHDAGKPAVFTVDEHGVGHAYGHAEVSVRLAEQAMERLRVDNRTRDRVLLLVRDHDLPREKDRRELIRRLQKFGEEGLLDLLEVQRADALGKGTFQEEAIEEEHARRLALLRDVLSEHPCVSLRDLAVGGQELMEIGVAPGKRMGSLLNDLLEAVVSGVLPNEKEALLQYAMIQIGKEEGTC